MLLWDTSAIIVCLLKKNESCWDMKHMNAFCSKGLYFKKYISCSMYSRRLEDYDPDLQQVDTQKKSVESGNDNI